MIFVLPLLNNGMGNIFFVNYLFKNKFFLAFNQLIIKNNIFNNNFYYRFFDKYFNKNYI